MTVEILEYEVNPKQRTRTWEGDHFVYDFPILTAKAKAHGVTRTVRVPLYSRDEATVAKGLEAVVASLSDEQQSPTEGATR